MLRRLRNGAIFLVLGAVINYSLAMGIIWFGPVGKEKFDDFAFHGTGVLREDTPGMTMVYFAPYAWDISSLEPGDPPTWSRIHHLSRPLMSFEDWRSLFAPATHIDVAAGWPRRSLMYEYDYYERRPQGSRFSITSGIELPPRPGAGFWGPTGHPRAIPLGIIPAGFALNTLLFASLAAIAWYTPPAIRRIRRTRGNRCLKCGYSREGLADEAACPECGGK